MIKACVDLIACMEDFEAVGDHRLLEFLNKAVDLSQSFKFCYYCAEHVKRLCGGFRC